MQTGLGLSLRQTRGFVWTSYRRRPLACISYRRGAICLRDLQLANRRKGRWASGLNFIQTPLGVSKGSWSGSWTDERRLDLDELQGTWAVQLAARRPGWMRDSLGEEM